MIVIGIAGEMESGKDTAFRALSLYENVCRVALADSGKAFWNSRDDIHKAMPLPDVPNMRRLWQVSLTEDREEAGVYSLWVDLVKWQITTLRNRLGYQNFVVTDIRRDYEVMSLNMWLGRKYGAWYETWKIISSKPKSKPKSDHVSETGIDRIVANRIIKNDGTIDDFVKNILECWRLASKAASEYKLGRQKWP